ncbi:hypothetical protein FJY90_02000, partial [Candidatus Gottesmanbacteria bacterium]|nr:hypothetical protein [Candidatus Gottesmanbacteria bacterium]
MPTLLNDQFHKMNHIPSYWPILVFLLLLLPAILPVFKPYVTGTADGLGHKFRLVSFYESLSEGNLRPRWAKEAALGYGAPVFLYNYPLPYYFASLFVRLGNSINGSGQLLSAFSLLFSAIFMFLAVEKLTGSLLGGLTAAIVYTYAPYHLQMTYLYDSWGEELAFVFPPLILYLIFNLANHFRPHNKFEIINSKHKTNSKSQNPKTRNILGFGHLNFSIVSNFDIRTVDFIFLVLCWSLFILSHNISAVMFSPVILVLAFVLTRNKVGP